MTDLVDLLGFPSVTLILGKRGSGKSAFGYRVLEEAHGRGLPCYVMGLPPSKRPLLPEWIYLVEDPRELGEDSAVFCDEAYMLMFARDSMRAFNRLMAKLMGITRQRNQIFLLATHLTRKLDVGVVYDADNLVFRQPSHLHARFERPELGPMLEEADRFFRGLGGNPVEWAYVINERGTFRVRVELPSFWSEELSKAFAAVPLVEPERLGLSENERKVLAEILRLHERGEFDERFGWSMDCVPGLTGGLLMKFLAMGLVRRGYTSRSTKCFYGNVEKIKEALGLITRQGEA